jgi:hypothetical protein
MITRLRSARVGSAVALAAVLGQCASKDTGGVDLTPAMDMSRDMLIAQDMTGPADMASPVRPTIASITPASAVNSGGTVLSIKGSQFHSGAVVTVAGLVCPTISATDGQITCTLPAKAATCGRVAVTVTNPDNRSATDSSSFSYRTSKIGFGNLINLPNASSNSRIVAAADWNGDGKIDIANSNFGVSTVSVRLGNGDGTFGAVSTLSLPSAPGEIAVADRNGI